MVDTAGAAPNLGLLLFIPYRFMETAVLAELKAHGHVLPLSQARVFQRIGPDGSRMADLAEAAQVSKQTLTSIVDQLQLRGYVTRTADPVDARARVVTITPSGKELIELSRPVIDRIEQDWESHVGHTRITRLRQLLAELVEITDPYNR